MTDELIGKYIAGEATAEEAAAVRRWLAENPDHPAELARLERIWQAAGTRPRLISSQPGTYDTDRAWQQVRAQMHRPDSEAIPEPEIRPLARPERLRWLVWARVAATVLLVSTLSFLVYRLFQTPDAIAPTSTTFLTQTTTTQTRQITLPDGSTVLLNRRSSLRYPDTFTGQTREVTLTGEGFFDVKPNKSQPFIIHAQDTDVRVVGTSFGVRAYDRAVRVSVKTGRVLVRKRQQEVALVPGQEATVDAVADTLRRLPRFDVNTLAYSTKHLHFTNQTLSSVVATLSNYYQTDINLAASRLQNCRLTATFENEPVETVLGVVAETLSLSVKRTEKGFVLTGEGCGQ
ncbi:MAG: DUF4974 domain-containing protein [Cytophagales bacterium]|nr:MAG: DUF4974 domain-containing protein [Cytophagales bacterium]